MLLGIKDFPERKATMEDKLTFEKVVKNIGFYMILSIGVMICSPILHGYIHAVEKIRPPGDQHGIFPVILMFVGGIIWLNLVADSFRESDSFIDACKDCLPITFAAFLVSCIGGFLMYWLTIFYYKVL